jgi:hypothetical protein
MPSFDDLLKQAGAESPRLPNPGQVGEDGPAKAHRGSSSARAQRRRSEPPGMPIPVPWRRGFCQANRAARARSCGDELGEAY